MSFDALTRALYQENINWIYSIIKELDAKGIERKEKFIADVYDFSNMVILGYYFMNLYVISNMSYYTEAEGNKIMASIINGASSYNQRKLSEIYKKEVDLNRIIEQYNTVVRKTKEYAPNDGLKARVIAVDEVYRRLYNVVNRRHFNIFVKIFMASFYEYEQRIQRTISKYLK